MIWRSLWRAALVGTIGFVLGAGPLHLWASEPLSAAKRLPTGDLKPAQSVKPAQPVVASELRAGTNRALIAPFPGTSAERRTQAEKLVSLYKRIGDAKEMTTAERSRLQARLKSRLARLADAIAVDVKQARGAGSSEGGSRSAADTRAVSEAGSQTAGSQRPAGGSNGGAPQDDGQALVELIQATIAPQSWDVNGGPGSIVYWPAWHVLVVRQTDDVHEQIGGVMHGMRK